MSEVSDSNLMPSGDLTEEEEVHAQWTMLLTILLLIAGFLFASTLLMHQVVQARSPEDKPIFQLFSLIEKGKSFAARAPARETPSEEIRETQSSPLEGIKKIVISQVSSEKVRWPRLRMTGFGKAADGSEGFAIINGELVHPGELAGKVTLVEVRAHDVVVEYKGERKNLTVELKD